MKEKKTITISLKILIFIIIFIIIAIISGVFITLQILKNSNNMGMFMEDDEPHYIYTASISGDSSNVNLGSVQCKDDGTPYVFYKVEKCKYGHLGRQESVTGVGTHPVNYICRNQRFGTSDKCLAAQTFYITITKTEIK